MATIIFTALGTLVGGPLGGALGALAGRQVDALVLGGGTREGPRLTELGVTTSSYGMPIPRHFGRMRVPGQIIWATDLQEHRDRHGNGKGRPSTVTYTYSASFAVALSSRPILDVGRIWADGKLLRGSAGDLKVGGALRLYRGEGDQAPDPLIAGAEGGARAPGFRGLAYAVFEDLQLAEYGNRIPALTFEVIADTGTISLDRLLEGVIADHDAAVPLDGIAGLSCEGPLDQTLAGLDPLFPVDCDAGDELLTIRPERLQSAALALPDPATSDAQGDFGGKAGFTRKRAPESEQPVAVLRYYDIGRDYQPGAQRAAGRPLPGQPRTIELPAAMPAGEARRLVDQAARRGQWSRQTLSWRITEIDPAVRPGAIVTVPGQPGQWRVREWEWHAEGIDLALARIAPTLPAASLAADPGRANPAPDLAPAPSVLAAFELPWDGSASRMPPQIVVAVSSPRPSWSGAALFVDQGDGALQPLGPSGRGRSVMGTALDALPTTSPLLFDRQGAVTIELVGGDLALVDATMRQLAMGANRALLGNEIVQFRSAVPLGLSRWRLSGLWRGRGGTESAVAGHAAGETFVLLDGTGIALDVDAVGSIPGTLVAAIGLADTSPVVAPIALRGIGLRPLAPVHARVTARADGSLRLDWVRRARGAWTWDDAIEVPLNEQAETYLVTYGPEGAPIASWDTHEPWLEIAALEVATLLTAAPGQSFRISQRGDRGVSEPLVQPIV